MVVRPTGRDRCRILRLAYWNANSIRNNKLLLVQFLSDHGIDIWPINEAHLVPKQDFRMVNYVCHRNDRSTLRGGTMLLVRHDDHYLVPFSNLRQMGGQLSSWRSMYVSSRKKYVCTLPDIDRNPPVSKPYFQFREVGLQIFYQKCWMLRRCY